MAGPLEVLARLRKAYGDQSDWWPVDRAWHTAHGTDWRFEVCVGAILAQNTTWGNVETALANLRAANLLDAKRLHKAPPKVVQEAVRPAGFFNQKTDYLRNFARYVANAPNGLADVFRGPLPKARELLLSFTGIGEETADDILVYAGGYASFVVDAYLRRLTKRLALGTGEESYDALQRLWGQRLIATGKAFGEAHALVVEHAKRTCTARMPRCPGCPLEAICPQIGVDDEVYRRLP